MASHKTFDVALVYGNNAKVKLNSITELTAEEIGSLVIVKAIVVRASEVKP
jgi:DNA replication licensing factor MCM7